MRLSTRGRLAITIALAFMSAVAIFSFWIIPGTISGRIRALVPGSRVRIDRWWVIGRAGGIDGIAWFEGFHDDSIEWARARRVETDLGLSALFAGRTSPGRIILIEPIVSIRIDRNGRLIHPPGFRKPADSDPLATVELKNGTLKIEQEGRPPLIVSAIDGTLKNGPDGWKLTARTQDSHWGHWRVDAQFAADFQTGTLTISGLNVQAGVEKTACIPWVSPRVWERVGLDGPMDVRETITYASGADRPVRAETWVNLRGTNVSIPRLHLEVEGVRGEVAVADRVVKINHANGFALDGTIGIDGTIDYRDEAVIARLDARLDDVSITEAPANWRLEPLEISAGRLSGTAAIHATAGTDRLDLSGSTGEAVVKQARVRGIPVESLTIRMQGEGSDLRYESDPPPAAPPLPSAFSGRLMQAARLMSGLAAVRAGRPGARLLIPLNTLGKRPGESVAKSSRVDWPAHATGRIVLDHIAIESLMDEAARAGVRLPFEASGRISIELDSTLPIDDPAHLGGYRGAGSIEFHEAEIAGIALDEIRARVRLADGVLELSEFQPMTAGATVAEPTERVAAVAPTTAR